MEGTDRPLGGTLLAQALGPARAHFLGRLVGEGDRRDAARRQDLGRGARARHARRPRRYARIRAGSRAAHRRSGRQRLRAALPGGRSRAARRRPGAARLAGVGCARAAQAAVGRSGFGGDDFGDADRRRRFPVAGDRQRHS
ncbi:hypothetical protein G6F55_013746 [Rhizopus delemar]|nr:hypothetical protein G6F55_013746 [Rhizopus delemar]